MYAIVRTGGKQYRVAPGDVLSIEKVDAEVGKKIELPAICVVDGKKVETDASQAATTKVMAEILDQYKGDKQLVFKFKKRKNYKRLRGHRQNLTRVRVISVGSEKFTPKKGNSKPAEKAEAAVEAKASAAQVSGKPSDKAASKPAEKKASTTKPKSSTAKSASKSAAKNSAKKPAAKKPAAKKAAAKKEDTASKDAE